VDTQNWSGEARYRALLEIAEAANRHLDLSRVLDSVALALEPLVPIDAIGVITRDGETFRALAAYHRDLRPAEDESDVAYARRLAGDALERDPHDDPGANAQLAQLARTRQAYAIPDVAQAPGLSRNTRALVERYGLRSLLLVPLSRGEDFIGGAMFARMAAAEFSVEEVSFLEDVSRPVAIAVANALAFQEIASLRARLEDENLALQEEISSSAAVGGIIGSSPSLRAVLERVARVAATDSTVLISGETGTGKELVARAIHSASTRAGRALIKVNCAALPEGLVASELFGHEKGAFTGALQRRRGRFELASGGTLFLDEVGELPPPVQVALLRVLQEGEFERVGGSETLRTNARLVAASNRDLEEAVREGRFRADLFFRLNVFPIRLPPLRERVEDVPLLVEYYAKHYSRRVGKVVRGIAPKAMEILSRYAWPGNVRELQNVVERAVILTRGDVLDVPDFELPSLQPAATSLAPAADDSDEERRRIEGALAKSRGKVSGPRGAATSLGIPASTLEFRIRRLGIDKHAFRRRVS
jgi:formate hydrogenlyase transcriptional activator